MHESKSNQDVNATKTPIMGANSEQNHHPISGIAEGQAVVVNNDPLDFDFHYMLHVFYLLAGRLLGRLLDWYESLFTLNEKDQLLVSRNLSTHYQKKGQPEKAIVLIKKALEVASVNQKPQLLLTLADLYLAKGQKTEAESAFRLCLKSNPNSQKAAVGLACILEEKKEYKDAISLYENVLEKNQKDPETYYQLGLLYDKQQVPDKALHYLESAIKLNPKEIKYRQLMGFIYESSGKHDLAIPHFKKVMELEHAGTPS